MTYHKLPNGKELITDSSEIKEGDYILRESDINFHNTNSQIIQVTKIEDRPNDNKKYWLSNKCFVMKDETVLGASKENYFKITHANPQLEGIPSFVLVDENIQKLAEESAGGLIDKEADLYSHWERTEHICGFISGAKAQKEITPYSEADMIGFAEWLGNNKWVYHEKDRYIRYDFEYYGSEEKMSLQPLLSLYLQQPTSFEVEPIGENSFKKV